MKEKFLSDYACAFLFLKAKPFIKENLKYQGKSKELNSCMKELCGIARDTMKGKKTTKWVLPIKYSMRGVELFNSCSLAYGYFNL